MYCTHRIHRTRGYSFPGFVRQSVHSSICYASFPCDNFLRFYPIPKKFYTSYTCFVGTIGLSSDVNKSCVDTFIEVIETSLMIGFHMMNSLIFFFIYRYTTIYFLFCLFVYYYFIYFLSSYYFLLLLPDVTYRVPC